MANEYATTRIIRGICKERYSDREGNDYIPTAIVCEDGEYLIRAYNPNARESGSFNLGGLVGLADGVLCSLKGSQFQDRDKNVYVPEGVFENGAGETLIIFMDTKTRDFYNFGLNEMAHLARLEEGED